MKPIFLTSPHSGEEIPTEASWLTGLNETVLMCDVDRYVDELYGIATRSLNIPLLAAKWHRYVVDLNRLPSDIDGASVLGASGTVGKQYVSGLHWTRTTQNHILMSEPMTQELHSKLVSTYWRPFHEQVAAKFSEFHNVGFSQVYHLDVHSMPSVGTDKHMDPGQIRPQIVVSDLHGKSCSAEFRDLVIAAYRKANFEVKVNWPYQGGQITRTYGQPQRGQHTIQVEMSRAIYMDEVTRQQRGGDFEHVQQQLVRALTYLQSELPVT